MHRAKTDSTGSFARLRHLSSFVLLAVAVAAAIAYATAFIDRESRVGWSRYQPPAPAGEREARLEAAFLGADAAEARYRALVVYLLDGFMRHASPGRARVQYGGVGSNAGYFADGLEGFARTAPVFAAWVHGGRKPVIEIAGGERIDMIDVIATGIANGVDPASPEYWGAISERYDQRVVEAVDVARILWLTRAEIWDRWPAHIRANASRWLDGVNQVELRDGVWSLFPIVVNLVLADLDTAAAERGLVDGAREAFAAYKADYYLESGWFADDPRGVDFYNAWGISYELYWIHRIAPDFDAGFITGALAESGWLTGHLISPTGVPILGRSICYRTAVPVPVVAASLVGSDERLAGIGMRALDVVWRYFVERGGLRDGALTQGYFRSDVRIVDNYSGTGSCHWGLRSLVLAFLHGADDPFWAGQPSALAVEESDFLLELPGLGWRVIGDHASGNVVIEIPANSVESIELEPMTRPRRLEEFLTRRPQRPLNRRAKYDQARYSSARPFMLGEAEHAPGE
jgi:hypothetical protein